MITLFEKLNMLEVQSGQLAVCFLGQAGFILKMPQGRYLLLDPYVSDYCEEKIGLKFKRLIPPLIDADDVDRLQVSAYAMTHHHEDHLDINLIRAMQNTDFPFFAPPVTLGMLQEAGVAGDRCKALEIGSEYRTEEFRLTGVFADHGEYAPDAVGIVIESQGKTIYHMGDTCLNADELNKLSAQFPQLDLLIAPINGRYGNLDHDQAAEAVGILQPKRVVPCHFWMLPGNSGGDPEAFLDEAAAASPRTELLLFAPGEIYIL